MRRVLLSLLAVGLPVGTALAQCGPWGCPTRPPATVEKHREKEVTKQRPTPAWRYERAVGHRAAVVRVECWDGVGQWSKGSGVLIRWGKRIVVLTARHVVQDAKQVYVKFHNRKRHKAKVIKVDKRWDCAVLDIEECHWLSQCRAEGLEPAELAYGADATFHEGDRLETCGYGHDEKLAVNSGSFVGYRRSDDSPGEGPDDWMAVSGPARPGDSGGPVFDAKGRVAGILWGTDGREVICVQPGRIHALLAEATAEQLASAERRPTPPAAGPLEPIGREDGDQRSEVRGQRTEVAGLRPLLPWRADAETKDQAQDRRIDRILDALERQPARPRAEPPAAEIQPPPVKPRSEPQRSPLLAGLCVLAGAAAGCAVFFSWKKD